MYKMSIFVDENSLKTLPLIAFLTANSCSTHSIYTVMHRSKEIFLPKSNLYHNGQANATYHQQHV